MRAVLVAAVAILAACTPQPVSPTPSPSTPAQSASPTTSASPAAREETPRAMLSMPYDARFEHLGATTSRVGGITGRGAGSLAVDDVGRIYIYDQARLRVVVYENGKLVRSVAVPYVDQRAGALLVDGDRLFLRAPGLLEYEIDATTGALLAAAKDGSLYPRRRELTGGGRGYLIGNDAAGLAYTFTIEGPLQRYERRDANGALLAYAIEPLSQKGVDAYARSDGALFELASDFGGIGAYYVYALLAPSGSPASPRNAARAAPVAFGRSVPDRVTVSEPDAGTADLDETARVTLWRIASLSAEAPSPPAVIRPAFTARWNDGSTLSLAAPAGNTTAPFVWPGDAAELAAHALASSAHLAAAASGSVVVRIADLPGTQRALAASEKAALGASLASAFTVSEGELPGELEQPFPVYELVLGDGTVLRLHGDRYASVGAPSRNEAIAHDGRLPALVRQWLPVPVFAASDVRSLFLADRVMLSQGGDSQDISRWKASIVRALVGTDAPSSSFEPTGEPPATFTFTFADGRSEPVVVSVGSYTYRGRAIAAPGIMNIVYYRGVP